VITSCIKLAETYTNIVSLDDVKDHLNIAGSQDDQRILQYIYTAQEVVSRETSLSLLQTTWQEDYDAFPTNALETCHAPVQSITSFVYYDFSNTLNTLVSGTDYYAVFPSRQPAIILPATGKISPPYWQQETYRYRPDAVQLTYVAGSYVPPIATHAIKILCGYYNEQRGDPTTEPEPPGFERLLKLLRVPTYF
jgi:uncharacterized phiE125 gp8 family phage protein